MATTRIHLWITGCVQGVCFRHYTQEEALSLGVVGWVRNLRDGRVEVVAEGEAGAVERLVLWCYQGPSMAHVEDVTLRKEEPTGEFDAFRVAF